MQPGLEKDSRRLSGAESEDEFGDSKQISGTGQIPWMSDLVDVSEDDGVVKKQAAAPEVLESDSDDDVFSDISDNSDIFHVSVKFPDEARTPEDVEMQRKDSIAQHLRDYPLLPPDLTDVSGGRSF